MLYIVATPIGNLEDITLRALRVLKSVDMIAAEDTRRTIKLLNHYDIKTKIISFHEYSGPDKQARLLRELKEGKEIALVSDAGTPLISDPGAGLVTEAAAEGIEITSLPGACAAVTAMTLSGLDSGFVFMGFLSKKSSVKKEQILNIGNNDMPCVVYESPHALSETLRQFAEAFGEKRQIVIAKELTKMHENVFRGSLGEAALRYDSSAKGEYVLIIAAKDKPDEVTDKEIMELLQQNIASGMTKKDAAKATSEKLGIRKNRAYKLTI